MEHENEKYIDYAVVFRPRESTPLAGIDVGVYGQDLYDMFEPVGALAKAMTRRQRPFTSGLLEFQPLEDYVKEWQGGKEYAYPGTVFEDTVTKKYTAAEIRRQRHLFDGLKSVHGEAEAARSQMWALSQEIAFPQTLLTAEYGNTDQLVNRLLWLEDDMCCDLSRYERVYSSSKGPRTTVSIFTRGHMNHLDDYGAPFFMLSFTPGENEKRIFRLLLDLMRFAAGDDLRVQFCADNKEILLDHRRRPLMYPRRVDVYDSRNLTKAFRDVVDEECPSDPGVSWHDAPQLAAA